MKKINNSPFEMLNEAHTHSLKLTQSIASLTHLHTKLLLVAAGGALHTLLHTVRQDAPRTRVFLLATTTPFTFSISLPPLPTTLGLSCYSACALSGKKHLSCRIYFVAH